MRREYEMTAEDLATLLNACKPVPYMVFGGCEPTSPQESANHVWADLGRRMDFDWRSVQPARGKGERWFTAAPRGAGGQRDMNGNRWHETRRAMLVSIRQVEALRDRSCPGADDALGLLRLVEREPHERDFLRLAMTYLHPDKPCPWGLHARRLIAFQNLCRAFLGAPLPGVALEALEESDHG